MRPSEVLRAHGGSIRAIVARHRAGNPRVFGSVARGTDVEGSDLDLLVDPEPGMTLLDLGAIRAELIEILGIDIDLVTPGSVPARFDFAAVEPIP